MKKGNPKKLEKIFKCKYHLLWNIFLFFWGGWISNNLFSTTKEEVILNLRNKMPTLLRSTNKKETSICLKLHSTLKKKCLFLYESFMRM